MRAEEGQEDGARLGVVPANILRQEWRAEIAENEQAGGGGGGGQDDPVPQFVREPPGREGAEQNGRGGVAVAAHPHGPGDSRHSETLTGQPKNGGNGKGVSKDNPHGVEQVVDIILELFIWIVASLVVQVVTEIGGDAQDKHERHAQPERAVEIGPFAIGNWNPGRLIRRQLSRIGRSLSCQIANDGRAKLIGLMKLQHRRLQAQVNVNGIDVEELHGLIGFAAQVGHPADGKDGSGRLRIIATAAVAVVIIHGSREELRRIRGRRSALLLRHR